MDRNVNLNPTRHFRPFWGLVLAFVFMLTIYSNCSQVKFDESSSNNVTGGETFPCKSFVQINEPFVVPAQTSAGVCYYSLLFPAQAQIPSGGSTLASVRSKDILTQAPAAPYIVRSKSFSVTLQGPRTVKLSGTVSPMGPVKVDNYFLINMPSATKAYGTADCALLGTDVITFNGNPIQLNSFGFSAGLATIEPLDVTQGFPLNQNTAVNVWALDCGSFMEVSDVYIVFQ